MSSFPKMEIRATVALDGDTRRACNRETCTLDYGHEGKCSDGHDLHLEACQICGINQPICWFAEDWFWELVTGEKNGVCCPRCFDEAAEKKGILVHWQPRPYPSLVADYIKEGKIPALAPTDWTTAELESFGKLASEEQPKPTEHLIRAMNKR